MCVQGVEECLHTKPLRSMSVHKLYDFILFIICSWFLPGISTAQLPEWVVSFGNLGPFTRQDGYMLASGPDAVYATGFVSGTAVDFGIAQISAQGDQDILLMKLNGSGTPVWVSTAGGAGGANGDFEVGRLIQYDHQALRLLTAGQFSSAPSTFGQFQLNADPSVQNYYCGALDTAGNWLWVNAAWSLDSYLESISTDGQGNVLLTGNSSFGLGALGPPSIWVPAGGFRIRYSSDGTLLNADRVLEGGLLGEMCAANGFQAWSGCVSGGGSFMGTSIALVNGRRTAFIAKTDEQDALSWITTFASSDTLETLRLTVLPDGSVVSSGVFKGTLVFGADTLVQSGTNWDTWLSCSFPDGSPRWARHISADSGITVLSIGASADAQIYVLGKLHGLGDLAGQAYRSGSAVDAFVLRLDTMGICTGLAAVPYTSGYGVGSVSVSADHVYMSCDHDSTFTWGAFEVQAVPFSGNGMIAELSSMTGFASIKALILEDGQLTIYPNPSKGSCIVMVPEPFVGKERLSLEVYSLDGRIMHQQRLFLGFERTRVDLSALSHGVYTVHISDGKSRYVGLMVVE